jgi:hypothetical protein
MTFLSTLLLLLLMLFQRYGEGSKSYEREMKCGS